MKKNPKLKRLEIDRDLEADFKVCLYAQNKVPGAVIRKFMRDTIQAYKDKGIRSKVIPVEEAVDVEDLLKDF